MIIAMIVQMVGHNRVKPSVYFNPIAQPTSNTPGNAVSASSSRRKVHVVAHGRLAAEISRLKGVFRSAGSNAFPQMTTDRAPRGRYLCKGNFRTEIAVMCAPCA